MPVLADNGYFSEANVMVCVVANVEPLIAAERQPHHPSWRERFAAAPPAPKNPTPVETMAWPLRTPQGKNCPNEIRAGVWFFRRGGADFLPEGGEVA
jgi:hypothetical protein